MNSLLPPPRCIERRDRFAVLSRPIAPAVYLGFQEGFGPVPGFDLWNLTGDIGAHKAGSTVTTATILEAGFRLPSR